MAASLSEMSLEELLALRKSLASGVGGLGLEEYSDPYEPIKFKRDYSGGNALTRGLSRGVDVAQMGYGSALEGLGKGGGRESLQQYGGDIVAEQEAELAAKAPYATRLKDVKEAEGVLGTAGALASFTGSALGESLPQMGTTIGGSLAGAAAGARAGSILGAPGAVVGGIAGGLLANVPFFYGMNREAQKEAVEQGYRTEMNEGAAFLASLPQSVMDLIADRLLIGLGPKVGVDLEKLSRRGGLFTRGTKGAALGAIAEVPTEVGQQLIERYQAGMPIDTPEAVDEYLEVMAAAGLVGGSIRGTTNIVGGDLAKAEERKNDNKNRIDERNKIIGGPSETSVDDEIKELELIVKSFGSVDTEKIKTLEAELEDLNKATESSIQLPYKEQIQIDADIKRIKSELEQARKGTKKYIDPTAGLAPELIEEKNKLQQEIDNGDLTEAQKEAKTLRISDIDTQINDFAKANSKEINKRRKDARAKLRELKERQKAGVDTDTTEAAGVAGIPPPRRLPYGFCC